MRNALVNFSTRLAPNWTVTPLIVFKMNKKNALSFLKEFLESNVLFRSALLACLASNKHVDRTLNEDQKS